VLVKSASTVNDFPSVTKSSIESLLTEWSGKIADYKRREQNIRCSIYKCFLVLKNGHNFRCSFYPKGRKTAMVCMER